MKAKKVQVRTKGKVVSEIEVPVYATLDEIMEAENATKIVKMFNKANIIELQNEERNKYSGTKAGKLKRRRAAFNLLKAAEIAQFEGDMDKLIEYLESAEMQNRADEELARTGEVVEAAAAD
jgi:hypothetical protein